MSDECGVWYALVLVPSGLGKEVSSSQGYGKPVCSGLCR